jgi:hypothetical protein
MPRILTLPGRIAAARLKIAGGSAHDNLALFFGLRIVMSCPVLERTRICP